MTDTPVDSDTYIARLYLYMEWVQDTVRSSGEIKPLSGVTDEELNAAFEYADERGWSYYFQFDSDVGLPRTIWAPTQRGVRALRAYYRRVNKEF